MSNVETKVSSNLIPVGYKQTEVGVIPEDWDIYCFSDCGYFQSGSGFPTKYQGEQEGDYPFFKVSDMNNIGNENILRSSNNYISENIRNLIAAKIIPVNAIIFAKIGAAIFLERKKICFQPSCIDNNLMAYIVNNDKLYYKYAYLLFKNIKLGHLVETTALPSLSSRDIGQKKMAFPAMEEQAIIANALSDVDVLITELEKLIAKKQAIKTATMQQLLTGCTRLPQFTLREDGSKKGTKQSELGEIPEDWEIINIEELGHVDPENLSSTTSSDYEFNYISLEQIEKGVLLGTIKTIFKNAPSRARRVIKKGDILVSTVRPNLMSHYFIQHDANDLICSTGFSVIRFYKEKLCPGYLYQHLFSSVINNQIDMLISGSNYPAINSGDVKKLKIQVGNVEEQTAIAAILSDMDEEIQALDQRLSKTRQIKQGMMQELLTGKTRLV